MQNAWVLNQEILINPELYHPCQGHNAVTPVRLEPAAPRSRVKHSTTEPLRYLFWFWWDGVDNYFIRKAEIMDIVYHKYDFGYNFLRFSPYKCIRNQIWPCHKVGQGQPRFIIWANLPGPHPQCYISSPKANGLLVPEKKISKEFLPYMGVVAI